MKCGVVIVPEGALGGRASVWFLHLGAGYMGLFNL